MKLGSQMGRRKRGGAAPDPEKDVYAGKDSPTAKEAEERKSGGAVKRKAGGGVQQRSEGGAADKRHDRPGRKRGGGVGSDMRPLTSANKTRDAEGHTGELSGEAGTNE